MFELQFPATEIEHWASRRDAITNDALLMDEVIPRVKERGFFDKNDFLILAMWAVPREKVQYESNEDDLIQTVTRIALNTQSEQRRIEESQSLKGVQYLVASVILHLAHDEPYPIINGHALASLGVEQSRKNRNFSFWWKYTKFCRNLAEENGVDMRTLDRALWQYSKENQPKR
jgi:hypothetical protein